MTWVKALLVAAALLSVASAQEGHPLTGTWHGTWGPDAKTRNDVTVVMQWDGKEISGMVNPGPDSVKLENAKLTPAGWMVHFEGDAKGVKLVVDGKIENLTNVRRVIAGTWVQGSVKGDFKITRDN